MADTGRSHPSLFLDILIVAAGVSFVIFASRFGLEAGHPATRGLGTVLGGLYVVYLGVLFLLSYFFSSACYVFSFLGYICTNYSRPASRHMALFYFALSLVIGSYVLLTGLG